MLEDFLPMTLPIDFVSALGYLPRKWQPWRTKLVPLVQRESKLHLNILNGLRRAIERGQGPDCFGTLLLEVYNPSLPVFQQ